MLRMAGVWRESPGQGAYTSARIFRSANPGGRRGQEFRPGPDLRIPFLNDACRDRAARRAGGGHGEEMIPVQLCRKRFRGAREQRLAGRGRPLEGLPDRTAQSVLCRQSGGRAYPHGPGPLQGSRCSGFTPDHMAGAHLESGGWPS